MASVPCSSSCIGIVAWHGGSREPGATYITVGLARVDRSDRRRLTTGWGLRCDRHVRRTGNGGDLHCRRARGTSAAPHHPEDPMIAWGAVVFIGLWLILADVKPVAKAKL